MEYGWVQGQDTKGSSGHIRSITVSIIVKRNGENLGLRVHDHVFDCLFGSMLA